MIETWRIVKNMNEFVRFIEQRDFEDGINLRLLVGTVAVGDICKIRFEDSDTGFKERPLCFMEATIDIISKREDNGLLRLDYSFEALRLEGSYSLETDFFDEDSIARSRKRGVVMRTYLFDEPDSRWDNSLSKLVELESTSCIRQ